MTLLNLSSSNNSGRKYIHPKFQLVPPISLPVGNAKMLTYYRYVGMIEIHYDEKTWVILGLKHF